MKNKKRKGIEEIERIEKWEEKGGIDEGINIRIRKKDLRIIEEKIKRKFFKSLRRIGNGEIEKECGEGERKNIEVRMSDNMMEEIRES